MKKTYKVKSLSELAKIASEVKSLIHPRTLLLLQGNLGTGKTTFVKKILGKYGLQEKSVKSPTFSLINVYRTEAQIFHHLDLYRLSEHDQFLLEEIKEILEEKNAIVFIEWPEKIEMTELAAIQELQLIKISISFSKDNFRNFQLCVN